jgi:hypothetical protein
MPEPTSTHTRETPERKPYIKAVEKNNETVVVAEKSYITSKRLPAISLADAIENPGVARANAAVSVEKPEGDLEWARKCDGYVRKGTMICLRSIALVPMLMMYSRPFSSTSSFGIAMATG